MEEVISKNELIKDKFKLLGLDCPTELIAQWAIKEQITDKNYDTVLSLLDCIKMLRDRNRCKLIKSMSRLPQIAQRTFDNFDVSRISSMNKNMFDHLKSLSFSTAFLRFSLSSTILKYLVVYNFSQHKLPIACAIWVLPVPGSPTITILLPVSKKDKLLR